MYTQSYCKWVYFVNNKIQFSRVLGVHVHGVGSVIESVHYQFMDITWNSTSMYIHGYVGTVLEFTITTAVYGGAVLVKDVHTCVCLHDRYTPV